LEKLLMRSDRAAPHIDDAASRRAIDEAVSRVLENDPAADPVAFTPEQINEVFLLTLAFGIFEILRLEVGKTIQENAKGDSDLENRRLEGMREYVTEAVRQRLDRLRQLGRAIAQATIDQISAEALRLTMDVFADDIR
jgi:hypothetical protein